MDKRIISVILAVILACTAGLVLVSGSDTGDDDGAASCPDCLQPAMTAGPDGGDGPQTNEEEPEQFTVDGITYKVRDDGEGVNVVGHTDELGPAVTIPSEIRDHKVVKVGGGALSGCNEMETLTVEPGVSTLDNGCFRGCGSLTEATVGEGTTEMGNSVFQDCTALRTLKLPSTLERIFALSFYNMPSLETVEVADGGKYYCSVDGMMFIHGDMSGASADKPVGGANRSLYLCPEGYRTADVVLPDDTVCIMSNAFSKCVNVESVTIPEKTCSIGRWVFNGCSSLTEMKVADGNGSFAAKDGVLYSADGKTLVCYPPGREAETFEVPDDVTTIGYSAFESSGLKEIVLPDGLTTIRDSAFGFCNGLKIAIPDTVTLVEGNAFSEANVDDLTIGMEVTGLKESFYPHKFKVGDSETDSPIGYRFTLDGKDYSAQEAFIRFTFPGGDSVKELVSIGAGPNDFPVFKEGQKYSFYWDEDLTEPVEDGYRVIGPDFMFVKAEGNDTFQIEMVTGGPENERAGFEFGSPITIPDPVRDGYVFGGWYTDPDMTVPFDTTVMPAKDLRIFAKWDRPHHLMIFDLQNGRSPITSDVPDGSKFKMPYFKYSDYDRSHELQGWRDRDTGDYYEPGDFCFTPERDAYFLADWKMKFTQVGVPGNGVVRVDVDVDNVELVIGGTGGIVSPAADMELRFPDATVMLPAEAVDRLARDTSDSVLKPVSIGLRVSDSVPQSVLDSVSDGLRDTLRDVSTIIIVDVDGSGLRDGLGDVTVTLPFELRDGESASDVTVLYIAEDGSYDEVPAGYDAETGELSFVTDHFSTFAVTYGEIPAEEDGMPPALILLIGVIAILAVAAVCLSSKH